jgi:serine/threonine-protein kinase
MDPIDGIPDGLAEALADRYRIERQLGEGGMATVYLAEDVKHERKVALKVLKPELAAVIGGERFVTEIKTTAGLQHPHILPLFDSGEADGFLYYVMPYVDGETLRDRLNAERQLPVDEALKLTRACAEALDYAHRQDVIHRDIKPENILLHEGNPVVADFGIALAISAAGGGRLTETGLSLGTPHYMSPEQATADRDLSARSDVYSLGAVLYEMLAGDPPHTGPSAQAILMRILTEDPRPITDTRRSVPPNVASAVAKSLEKLPADRFESAAAFAEALDDRGFTYTAPQRAATAPTTAPTPAAATAGGSWWTDIRSVVAMALLVVSIGALGLGLSGGEDEAAPATVVRAPFYADGFVTAAMSHDGSMVAYLDGGLWLHHLDEAEPQFLAESAGAGFATFSPDDEWVAFVSASTGGLRRVPVGGGSPITITGADAMSVAFTPFWGDDGRIAYTSMDGTYLVPWTGEGEPERVLEGGIFFQRSARLLPGSRALIYTQQLFGSETGSTRLLDLETGEDRPLIEDGVDARYVPTGHLLFGRADQSLFAVPFDVDALEVTGSEVAVLDSVGVGNVVGLVNFSVSETGTAIYGYGSFSQSLGESTDEIVFVEDGVVSPVGLPPGSEISTVRASPDGRYLAYQASAQSFVFDVIVGTNIPITAEDGPLFGAVWRPDGQSLDGVGMAAGLGIYNVVPRSDETGTLVALPPAGFTFLIPLDWTRDGQTALLQSLTGTDETDLWTMAAGDSVPQRYLDSDWSEENGDLSPDDAWVAYQSDPEGETAVYVRSFPEPGPAVRVSPGRGSSPRWSPEGDRIYFMVRDSVFAANVESEGTFTVESVEFLFSGDYTSELEVMPDGRLVMVRRLEPDEPDEPAEAETDEEEDAGPQAFIVVNWFEEMKARLGGGGN